MKTSVRNFITTLIAALTIPVLHAGPVVFDNDNGDLDWNKPANWSTNALPGYADTARIGHDHKVTISSAITTNTHSCHIGIGGTGSLTVNKGGSITFNHYAALGWDHLGTLTINEGGSFSSGVLGIGAYVTTPGRGPGAVLNMNGGSIKTGVIQATSDKAILNLAGGTITATGLRFPASNDDGVIINWDFSSGSSTTITVTGPMIQLLATKANFNLAGLKAGSYTLIDNKGTGLVDFSGDITVKNLAPGLKASVNNANNASGDNLVLTVTKAP